MMKAELQELETSIARAKDAKALIEHGWRAAIANCRAVRTSVPQSPPASAACRLRRCLGRLVQVRQRGVEDLREAALPAISRADFATTRLGRFRRADPSGPGRART
jgi:hypothetical protein